MPIDIPPYLITFFVAGLGLVFAAIFIRSAVKGAARREEGKKRFWRLLETVRELSDQTEADEPLIGSPRVRTVHEQTAFTLWPIDEKRLKIVVGDLEGADPLESLPWVIRHPSRPAWLYPMAWSWFTPLLRRKAGWHPFGDEFELYMPEVMFSFLRLHEETEGAPPELECKPDALVDMIDPGCTERDSVDNVGSRIKDKSPADLALLLAFMTPSDGALCLVELAPQVQVETIEQLAKLKDPSEARIRELERSVGETLDPSKARFGGLMLAAEILNLIPPRRKQEILDWIGKTDRRLVENIRHSMFRFDEFLRIGDREIQNLLYLVDLSQLGIFLKTAPRAVREKFFRNMLESDAYELQDAMDKLGPVRLADVEAAQQAIAAAARRLTDEGELSIERESAEEPEREESDPPIRSTPDLEFDPLDSSDAFDSLVVLRSLRGVKKFRLECTNTGTLLASFRLDSEDLLARPDLIESLMHHLRRLRILLSAA